MRKLDLKRNGGARGWACPNITFTPSRRRAWGPRNRRSARGGAEARALVAEQFERPAGADAVLPQLPLQVVGEINRVAEEPLDAAGLVLGGVAPEVRGEAAPQHAVRQREELPQLD